MRIMEAVWPVSALYFGPLAWWAYARWGKPKARYREPVSVAIGVSHCGAGCTLRDILGAWLVFALGWGVFGLALGDTPSLLAFEVGLFVMRIGKIPGFLTAYPVNVWLVRRGIKERM